MSREIVIDTETTGLNPLTGDRVVEIGGVELFNHVPTGRHFHKYINPERRMTEDAFQVHGLSDEFLADAGAPIDLSRYDALGSIRMNATGLSRYWRKRWDREAAP